MATMIRFGSLIIITLALAALMLWSIYNTQIGLDVAQSLVPQEFWSWLHDRLALSGAEAGHDIELLVFTMICIILAGILVASLRALAKRWL